MKTFLVREPEPPCSPFEAEIVARRGAWDEQIRSINLRLDAVERELAELRRYNDPR